jgi:cell division protein FtsL
MKITEWTTVNRWRILGLITVFAGFLVINIFAVQRVKELMDKNRKLEHQLEIQQYENQGLRYRITSLESAERINWIAMNKLGMVPPQEVPRILK